MTVPPRITVVGSINMDLVFRTQRMPEMGETIRGHEFTSVGGGKGANQAVAAARQGAKTTLVACVGDDAYGQQSLNSLRTDQINTDYINIIADVATGVAGIFVDDAGHNSIVIAPGANQRLTPEHIDAARASIIDADLLICQCETPLVTISAAIQLATQHGVKVVFNPAPVMPLPDELLAQINYLVVNEIEAGQLSGTPVTDLRSAQAATEILLKRGVSCVLLTMGEHGVFVTHNGQYQHLPAYKVKVVDSTAAGDTFVGSFAAAIGRGLSLVDAIQQAQCSAGLTVTKLGAQSSIPYQGEVERFMAHK